MLKHKNNNNGRILMKKKNHKRLIHYGIKSKSLFTVGTSY